jgi:hypothetical protein
MNANVFGLDTGFDMGGIEPSHLINSMIDLDQVSKAMEAGAPVPSYSGGGSASPLFKQEIVDQLFMQCEIEGNVKFWPEVYKSTRPVQNTVVEYSKQTSVGSEFADIFQAEGSAGQSIDSEFALAYTKMRWISEKRPVSLQAQLLQNPVGDVGNMTAKATADASVHILTRLEHAMFYGDSAVNTKSFDGLKKIIADNVTATSNTWQVIDKRNTPMLLADIGDAQENIQDNVFGRVAKNVWSSVNVLKQLANEHGDRVKTVQTTDGFIPSLGGQALGQYLTQIGLVKLDFSYYLSPARKLLKHTAATHTTAPAAPTITSAVATGDAASKFVAADATDYTYKVVAIGSPLYLGASAPTSATPVTVIAGDKVTVTIANTANTGCQYYNIYRHLKGNSTHWYLIGQVACAGGSTATTFVDYNEEIPGCSDAFMLQQSPEVIMWREMMPYSMINLPQVDFLQYKAYAMFGTVISPIPAILRIKNISAV